MQQQLIDGDHGGTSCRTLLCRAQKNPKLAASVAIKYHERLEILRIRVRSYGARPNAFAAAYRFVDYCYLWHVCI